MRYYEDLFEHPRKLIEEMNALMQKTDEEILKWLQENSEDFQNSTEATQKDMVNSWQAMLDDMHGNIKTYWDEVESIIQQGDEAIIEFLKQNSADYRAASKLQAEAFVDEWKKKLEDLKNAFLNNAKEINAIEYKPVLPSTGSSGGTGGGGTGGGGSGADNGYYIVNGNGKKWTGYTLSRAQSYARQEADKNPPVKVYDKYGNLMAT